MRLQINTLFFAITCILPALSPAQDLTQTIRGTVRDKDSHMPLSYSSVAVFIDSVLVKGTAADSEGAYRLEDIPVGRYTVGASYVGYNRAYVRSVVVNSGKEVILDIFLEESGVKIEEVIVTAGERKGEALNQMAAISARAFSVEETERYAGSRGDPARMASNFAGVQGSDDSSNDIIVRGNSPLGLLWRLEGVNIPNPNHFGVAGTTGGPVSILNNKLLSNSDFMTSAFPAEYGNTVAGVFDLRMRNGNNAKHEFSGQWGFFGTELLAEGPLGKAPDEGQVRNRASYLVNYRYATVAIFHALGVNIGTDAVPFYHDASFKLNFPTGKAGDFSIFGIGGQSNIDLIKSTQTDPEQADVYGDADVDEYYSTEMGVAGMNFVRPLGEKSYLRLTVFTSLEHQNNFNDKIHRHVSNGMFVLDSLTPHLGYDFRQAKHGLSFFVNRKLSSRHTVKAGFFTDYYVNRMADSIFDASLNGFLRRLDYEGSMYLSQPYVQWRWKAGEKLTLNFGIHGQYLTLNNSFSAEPRAGLKWGFRPRQSLSIGYGSHSQMMPTYIYFARQTDGNGNLVMPNKNTGFTRSHHLAAGYDNAFSSSFRLRAEAYWQQLYDVPVEAAATSYSILNEGTELNRFFPGRLVNGGTGYNAGLELTLEKFFGSQWFGMVTASLYDSRYEGSNGETYSSSFNGVYAFNALGGYEFKWGNKNRSVFGVGGKLTQAGGRRYTPVDIAASSVAGYAVYDDAQRNAFQFRDYFRADIKLHYRLNTKKLTHEIGLDLVNITGQQNVLKQSYTGGDPPVREEYQLGFLPIFYYKIDF